MGCPSPPLLLGKRHPMRMPNPRVSLAMNFRLAFGVRGLFQRRVYRPLLRSPLHKMKAPHREGTPPIEEGIVEEKKGENLAQTAKRVPSLVQMGELSKAAAAVWGPGETTPAEAIKRQFGKKTKRRE